MAERPPLTPARDSCTAKEKHVGLRVRGGHIDAKRMQFCMAVVGPEEQSVGDNSGPDGHHPRRRSNWHESDCSACPIYRAAGKERRSTPRGPADPSLSRCDDGLPSRGLYVPRIEPVPRMTMPLGAMLGFGGGLGQLIAIALVS